MDGILGNLLTCISAYSNSDAETTPGCIPDTVNNAKFLRELYFKANPEYKGRFTVPVLWDKKYQTIVVSK